MKYLFLVLTLSLLAACDSGPMPSGIGPESVLPAEAQRIIDRATATAAAAATGAAKSTALRQATTNALADRQTEVSLSITLESSHALATATAGKLVAQAVEDATRSHQEAVSTALAVQNDVRATDAAIEASRAAEARREESARQWDSFWSAVRTVLVALIVVAGLTLVTVMGFDRVTAIRLAGLAAQAQIAKDAFRLLAPGHWAEWVPGEGYQVYPMPALAAAEAVIENVPVQPNREFELRQAVRLFCWWGDMYGFGYRTLGPGGRKVVTNEDWRLLTHLLKDAGVLAERVVPPTKAATTTWAEGYTYARLHDDLNHGRVELKWPADRPIPKVAFTVPVTVPA